jgi:hypothetical protein
VYHWVYFTGTDGYVHLVYWNGSAYVVTKVGSNNWEGCQMCVDSVWHILWYTPAGGGPIVSLYWNGSTWAEANMDIASADYRATQYQWASRLAGVDENWHVVWNVALTSQDKLITTSWNGSAWVSGVVPGTTDGAGYYFSIGVSSSSHEVYSVMDHQGGLVIYWNGSSWTPYYMFYDGNYPKAVSPYQTVFVPSAPNSCFVGYSTSVAFNSPPGANYCLCTTYATGLANWASFRMDSTSGPAGSNGLFPLAVGAGGQAVLCCIPGTSGTWLLTAP